MANATTEDLESFTRDGLIDWLVFNDPNGCYRDHESIAECGTILTKEEAYEIAIRQISGY
jgi:hypothetical protein